MNLYKEYASLKLEKDLIEERISDINKAIVEDMGSRKVLKEESDFGKFTICTKKSYKYSAKVTLLEEKIKVEKFKEQEKGIAKLSESHYLLYSNKKGE